MEPASYCYCGNKNLGAHHCAKTPDGQSLSKCMLPAYFNADVCEVCSNSFCTGIQPIMFTTTEFAKNMCEPCRLKAILIHSQMLVDAYGPCAFCKVSPIRVSGCSECVRAGISTNTMCFACSMIVLPMQICKTHANNFIG